VLTYLGTISFPIFVVHGALGQVFYKKIIATKLWGAVMPQSFFPVYCLIVLASAAALQHLFLVRTRPLRKPAACMLTLLTRRCFARRAGEQEGAGAERLCDQEAV
jgi:peptidoglycan/LPS O-acetylase OafA/YrhL